MDRGRLQQLGSPDEIYERPANTFVAAFVGSPAMNLLRGRLVFEEGVTFFEGPAGRWPLQVARSPSDGEVILGVRPEDLVIGEQGRENAWDGTVILREPSGPDVFLTVRVSGTDLVARTDRGASAVSGSRVSLSPHPGRLHLFDADTGKRIDSGEAQGE